jgi:hypothetical protein
MPQTVTNRDDEAYSDFVARCAADLREAPENALSLMSGREFLGLGPQLFERVTAGCARFGTTRATLHDDILAAAGTPPRWGWRRVARGISLALRVLGIALCVVLPLSLRGSRSPTPKPLAARRTRRDDVSPTASVVVLSFDRLTYLRETLQAFLDTAGGSGAELIVVDQGSRDGSAEFLEAELRRGNITKLALRDANHGISAGYNLGFALADPRSAFLMKLDSDIRPLTPGWLDQALDFLRRNPQVGFVALNQENHSLLRVLPVRTFGGHRVMDFGAWPCGSAMIVPRRVHDEVGCFIEHDTLKYAPDDIDYYSRVSRKGYRVYFLHDLWVHHQVHLDRGRYQALDRAKPRGDSAGLALALAHDYDRGTRPLELAYPRYAGLAVPADGVWREAADAAGS